MTSKKLRDRNSFGLDELDLDNLGPDGLGRYDYRWDIDRIEGCIAFKRVPLRVFEHLMDNGLSREDLALLFVLLGHESQHGVCKPSHKTIAQCLGWKPSSRTLVHEAVKRLKERNMLRVTRTKTSNRYDLSPWLQSFEKYEIKRAANEKEMFVAIPCYVLKHGPRLIGIQKFLYILLLSSFKNDIDDPRNHGVVTDYKAAQRLAYKDSRQVAKMRKALEEQGYLDIQRDEDILISFSLHGIASACRDAAISEAKFNNQQQHTNTLDSTLHDTGLYIEIHQTLPEVKPNKANIVKPSLAKARENNGLVEEILLKDDMLTEPEDYDWSFHYEQANSEAFYGEDTAIWNLENLPEHQANIERDYAVQGQNNHLQRPERLPSFDSHYRVIPVHQTVGA